MRLSPTGAFGDRSDSDPAVTFSHAARELNRFGLSFLHIMEALIDLNPPGGYACPEPARCSSSSRRMKADMTHTAAPARPLATAGPSTLAPID